MKRTVITALLLVCGFVAGCDLCETAAKVHTARCADGDQASCEWMLQHVEPSTGQACG